MAALGPGGIPNMPGWRMGMEGGPGGVGAGWMVGHVSAGWGMVVVGVEGSCLTGLACVGSTGELLLQCVYACVCACVCMCFVCVCV